MPTSNQRARKILGKNYFGIEESIKYISVVPLEEEFVALAEIPFSEVVLEECASAHILVAVFPLSILDIRRKVDRKLFFGHENAFYNNLPFANDVGEASWQFVRKTELPNSSYQSWNNQQALLAKDEEVAGVRVMVYTIIGHYLATGERLFEKSYVRTKDVDPDYGRVSPGMFGSFGLSFYNGWNGYPVIGLGLAAVKKPS